jgi:hypothetical protein
MAQLLYHSSGRSRFKRNLEIAGHEGRNVKRATDGKRISVCKSSIRLSAWPEAIRCVDVVGWRWGDIEAICHARGNVKKAQALASGIAFGPSAWTLVSLQILCHSSTRIRWPASINFLNRNRALPAASRPAALGLVRNRLESKNVGRNRSIRRR